MINTSDISKHFILNKAVHDATNILLRPCLPVTVPESCTIPTTDEKKYEVLNRIKERWKSHSHDFLLKMATIAWDFLNVLDMFQSNLAHQIIEKDSVNNKV